MRSLFMGGSVVAAFFAGAVALFAPCCIVFLLPAYLATAVKNRRWRLLPLTFIFAAGLGVVLVPVTLGISMLSGSLQHFHRLLYFAGGLLLFAFAILALLGRSWSMPAFIKAPALRRNDSGGMFLLGVFSGVASSCCAPVLAAIMTMSVLASSKIGAVGLGIAYVFGMSFPLFALALLWDKMHLGERRVFQAKAVTLRMAGRRIETNTVNLLVALMFGAMGVMVEVLAANGNTTATPRFQLAIGEWLSGVFGRINELLRPVPEPILGLGLLTIATLLVVTTLRGRKGDRATEAEGGTHVEQGCCEEGSAGRTTAGGEQEEEPQPAR